MVVAGFDSDDFVWFAGPYLGAIIATVVYKLFVIARFPQLASAPGQPLISDDLHQVDSTDSDLGVNRRGKAPTVDTVHVGLA